MKEIVDILIDGNVISIPVVMYSNDHSAKELKILALKRLISKAEEQLRVVKSDKYSE